MDAKTKTHYEIAKRLATVLDDQFQFVGIKFGLDPILDTIPGLGDIIANLIGLYIIIVAREIGLPPEKIGKMVLNLVIDFLIGMVPVAGDVATIFYRSNRMNIGIIEDYLRKSRQDRAKEGEIVENRTSLR